MFATTQALNQTLTEIRARSGAAGTLFLVGESSLVVEALTGYCTEVIFAAEVGEYQTELCDVIDTCASAAGLAVSIEHPAEVIPIPLNAADRARPVTGFEDDASMPLKIRHFDPFSVAIRFMARGDEPDYHLVIGLLEAGWITMEQLENEVQDLLPRFSFDTIQQDPAEFRRKFKGLRQMWGAYAVE